MNTAESVRQAIRAIVVQAFETVAISAEELVPYPDLLVDGAGASVAGEQSSSRVPRCRRDERIVDGTAGEAFSRRHLQELDVSSSGQRERGGPKALREEVGHHICRRTVGWRETSEDRVGLDQHVRGDARLPS